jgi:protein involved in ribonucleotide reduction
MKSCDPGIVSEMILIKSYNPEIVSEGNKKWGSSFYRTATTLYPCCVPTLGEFKRSWS